MISHHAKQSIKVFDEEIVILEHTKNAEVKYDIDGTHNLLSSPSPFIMFKQKPTSIDSQRSECNKQKETPVPPTIENITCSNHQQILPASPTEYKPIEHEHYWQEYQKLE